MNTDHIESEAEERSDILTPLTLAVLMFTVAVTIMNLHTAQTLVGLIASDLSIPASMAGMSAMAPLAGYAIGLVFVVPLSDILESRRLALVMLAVAALAAGLASVSASIVSFLCSLLILGIACSCVQVLVPIAASLSPPEHRGQIVGNVMAGVMVGVLAARPFASFVADTLGWRATYGIASVATAFTAILLRACLPVVSANAHNKTGSYPALIGSLLGLLREEALLRRRATTAALMMTSFSMFWSTIALRLEAAPFGMDQKGIALFALVGAGGVLATPYAGRLGDRNLTRMGTIGAHVLVILAMLLAAWAGTDSMVSPTLSILLLGVSAVAIDVGLTTDHTLGRRAINLVRPEARGRMNGLFVGLFFIGGAIGAVLSGVTWSNGGWWLTCLIGAAFALFALILDFAWGRRDAQIATERDPAPTSTTG